MTIALTPTTSTANRKITNTQNHGHTNGAIRDRSWEIAMDSVVALLTDPRARLFSSQAINVLRQQVHCVEGIVDASDARCSLTDTWRALLALAEVGESDADLLIAGQRLVVVLAEMLCSPIQMPLRHRQCYWEILQGHLRMLNRTTGYEKALQRIDRRFPQWMESLNTASWCGKIRPVAAPSKILSRNKRRSADEELNHARYRVTSGASCSASNEAQYLGNASDHWRMHTSHR